MKEIIPPIKSQGIKTKLVQWINDLIKSANISIDANWYEPFFGTGVVGFNSPLQGNFIVGDTNPHIINFYKQIQDGNITSESMRKYLQYESNLLMSADENGYSHYRLIRDRFNIEHNPYDFIFLSRAGFNGMMRFNGRGDWNIPFCKKPNRFAPAYITKICNQINSVSKVISSKKWEFIHSDFEEIIKQAKEGDLIYCDPPYYGRYTDYFNSWTEQDEERLYNALCNTKANFILSTWHHNEFRLNEMIEKYWNNFNIITREHFYHGGGKIENRHAIVEALVFNFDYNKEKILNKNLF
jgi:DNA adenine methylase